MSSNIKIIISVIIVLIFTFFTLILVGIAFSYQFEKTEPPVSIINGENNFLTNQEFFTDDLSNQSTIFLIGSSHVGHINATQVNDLVLLDESIMIYNLAKAGDTPKERLKDIDQIISAKPKIVFYGISYRDFLFPFDSTVIPLLPDPKQMIGCALLSSGDDLVPSNPQMLTRNILNKIVKIPSKEKSEPESKNIEYFAMKSTPFYLYPKKPQIATDDIKKEDPLTNTWSNPNITIQNICALHKIISLLQNNEIKIVIFTTPLHSYYLESLTVSQKNYFSLLQNELSNYNHVKIYDFEDKYVELDVWHDNSHISNNQNVIIFDQDIAKMITMEIGK